MRRATSRIASAATTAAVVNWQIAMWSGWPYAPSGSERHDDVRADSSDVRGDALDRLPRVGAVEVAVAVVEQRHVANAQRGGRRAKLTLADSSELDEARDAGPRRVRVRGSGRARRVWR